VGGSPKGAVVNVTMQGGGGLVCELNLSVSYLRGMDLLS
jgi:hypothetical protein